MISTRTRGKAATHTHTRCTTKDLLARFQQCTIRVSSVPRTCRGSKATTKIGSHAAQILPAMEKGKDAVMPVVPPLDNAAAAQIVCRFFQYGTCRFGSSCRFIHPAEPAALGTHGSSCGSSGSSNSSTTGTSPADGITLPAKQQADADSKLNPSTLDLSRWIDAPVFVPKSKLSYQQQPQPPRNKLQHKERKGAPDEEEEEEAEEEEGEERELDDDERNNEADNEADNEEEEEEEEEDVEQDAEDGAVGYTRASLLSYASVVTMNNNHNGKDIKQPPGELRLCMHYEKHGICPLGDCMYLHGELCELCQRYCLDPRDKEQQRRHNADCIREHELEMEHAFAVQRSRDKSCGICLEVVMEKRAREQRFGILPNCKHTFCLGCIRTWRKANNFANKIKRSCPTCRVPSDFVCPSFVWVECGEEKERLIENYKQACNNTDCMHFKKGSANCPFGNKCFYRHALPSGELVDLGAPSRRRNPHRGRDRDMDHADTFQLQELFASLLAPRSWMLDEYMTSLFSELEDSEDDLDYLSGRGGGFPSDSSDYEEDFMFDLI